ncbi:MAG: hypothetical protein WCH21_12865 [Bacteroidota bacterium]
MDTLSRKQALNILRSNKWTGNNQLLSSDDELWYIFYDKIISNNRLLFSYKNVYMGSFENVYVGSFEFKRIGFIFKSFDPMDDLYIAYLAILAEIAEDAANIRERKKLEALKEIGKTYFK